MRSHIGENLMYKSNNCVEIYLQYINKHFFSNCSLLATHGIISIVCMLRVSQSAQSMTVDANELSDVIDHACRRCVA